MFRWREEGEPCAGVWGVEKPTGVRVAVGGGVFLQLLPWTLGTLRAPDQDSAWTGLGDPPLCCPGTWMELCPGTIYLYLMEAQGDRRHTKGTLMYVFGISE